MSNEAKFGGADLLEDARNLCARIESLPAGEHQTRLSIHAAQVAHALQELQRTGDYFWPQSPTATQSTGEQSNVCTKEER